jgi:hypothetical protein
MKPRLPPPLEVRFPSTVLHVLYSYVPAESPKSKPASPQLQKDLLKIQNAKLRGKNVMYLYDLDDFVLER